VQAAFNGSLLEEGVPSAWLDALAALRERFAQQPGGAGGAHHRPCQTLYVAVPDVLLPLPALPEAQALAEQADARLAASVAAKASACIPGFPCMQMFSFLAARDA
jgi:hypothetical protein